MSSTPQESCQTPLLVMKLEADDGVGHTPEHSCQEQCESHQMDVESTDVQSETLEGSTISQKDTTSKFNLEWQPESSKLRFC